MLDEIGDTIIPPTDTPGAKAAKIGEFMSTYVGDCYTRPQQAVFKRGLSHFSHFKDLALEKRHDFLISLEKEAKAFNAKKSKDAPEHYYTMIKQLTLFGYFTSEIGATQALRNVPIPGRYDGAFPYKKGDRAFNDDV